MSFMKIHHVKPLLLALLLTTYLHSAQNIETNNSLDCFLNPAQLKNSQATQQELLRRNFKKVYFHTADDIKLCGLLLDKSDVQPISGTIIYCAGFYPGTKEGMSSFYTLVANEPYNVLLFDARGHNESEGSFLSYQQLKQYTFVEYIDIITAIHFVDQYNQALGISRNIIVHGICSGAFNSTYALQKMTEKNDPVLPHVKGIIFDSGWLQVQDIVESTVAAELKKRLRCSYFAWAIAPLTNIICNIYGLIMKPDHAKMPNITTFLQTTTLPIWFVHCTNDPYVPCTPIQECTQRAEKTNTWWIDFNTHANYHMKHHSEYQDKLFQFLQQIK